MEGKSRFDVGDKVFLLKGNYNFELLPATVREVTLLFQKAPNGTDDIVSEKYDVLYNNGHNAYSAVKSELLTREEAILAFDKDRSMKFLKLFTDGNGK